MIGIDLSLEVLGLAPDLSRLSIEVRDLSHHGNRGQFPQLLGAAMAVRTFSNKKSRNLRSKGTALKPLFERKVLICRKNKKKRIKNGGMKLPTLFLHSGLDDPTHKGEYHPPLLQLHPRDPVSRGSRWRGRWAELCSLISICFLRQDPNPCAPTPVLST